MNLFSLFQPNTILNPAAYTSCKIETLTMMIQAHHTNTTFRAMLASIRPFNLTCGTNSVLHELFAVHDQFVAFVQINIRHANLLEVTITVYHITRIGGTQIEPQEKNS